MRPRVEPSILVRLRPLLKLGILLAASFRRVRVPACIPHRTELPLILLDIVEDEPPEAVVDHVAPTHTAEQDLRHWVSHCPSTVVLEPEFVVLFAPPPTHTKTTYVLCPPTASRAVVQPAVLVEQVHPRLPRQGASSPVVLLIRGLGDSEHGIVLLHPEPELEDLEVSHTANEIGRIQQMLLEQQDRYVRHTEELERMCQDGIGKGKGKGKGGKQGGHSKDNVEAPRSRSRGPTT